MEVLKILRFSAAWITGTIYSLNQLKPREPRPPVLSGPSWGEQGWRCGSPACCCCWSCPPSQTQSETVRTVGWTDILSPKINMLCKIVKEPESYFLKLCFHMSQGLKKIVFVFLSASLWINWILTPTTCCQSSPPPSLSKAVNRGRHSLMLYDYKFGTFWCDGRR